MYYVLAIRALPEQFNKYDAKPIACPASNIYVNILQLLKEYNWSCYILFIHPAYDQSNFTACVTSAQERRFLSQLIH